MWMHTWVFKLCIECNFSFCLSAHCNWLAYFPRRTNWAVCISQNKNVYLKLSEVWIGNLTFLCPCMSSITANDEQQDATILVCLFISNQLYMFRAMPSLIIRNTWLYLQLLILSTDIAAGCCHGWVGTAGPPHPWHQPAAISVDNIRSCKYSQVFLMMSEGIARNM